MTFNRVKNVKFKGRKVADSTFIYGHLVKIKNSYYIIPEEEKFDDLILQTYKLETYQVYPEYTYQYLFNINNKEVYEKDAIELTFNVYNGNKKLTETYKHICLTKENLDDIIELHKLRIQIKYNVSEHDVKLLSIKVIDNFDIEKYAAKKFLEYIGFENVKVRNKVNRCIGSYNKIELEVAKNNRTLAIGLLTYTNELYDTGLVKIYILDDIEYESENYLLAEYYIRQNKINLSNNFHKLFADMLFND